MKLIQKIITDLTAVDRSRLARALILVIVVIVLDQITKYYISEHFYVGESVNVIEGFFNFTYARNSGAAFGFGGEFHNWLRYALFLALPVFACIWLCYLLLTSVKSSLFLFYAYGLILGGAIGNLIDRFRLDYVVDFFDFYYGPHHFATFNIADTAISVAAGFLIIDYIIIVYQERKKQK